MGAHRIAVLRHVEHALRPAVEHALVDQGERVQRVMQVLSAPISVSGAKGKRERQHRSLDRGLCLQRSVHLRAPGGLSNRLGWVLFNSEREPQEGEEQECADEQPATDLNGKLRQQGKRRRGAYRWGSARSQETKIVLGLVSLIHSHTSGKNFKTCFGGDNHVTRWRDW